MTLSNGPKIEAVCRTLRKDDEPANNNSPSLYFNELILEQIEDTFLFSIVTI